MTPKSSRDTPTRSLGRTDISAPCGCAGSHDPANAISSPPYAEPRGERAAQRRRVGEAEAAEAGPSLTLSVAVAFPTSNLALVGALGGVKVIVVAGETIERHRHGDGRGRVAVARQHEVDPIDLARRLLGVRRAAVGVAALGEAHPRLDLLCPRRRWSGCRSRTSPRRCRSRRRRPRRSIVS